MPMQIIGTDGGYKNTVQTVTAFQIGVTERVDFLIDFSNIPVGTQDRHAEHRAAAPRRSVRRRIRTPTAPSCSSPWSTASPCRPSPSRPIWAPGPGADRRPAAAPPDPERRVRRSGPRLQAELDGQLFHELTTELPTVGSTEDWNFINTTPLDHNKHVHLIQFQVIDAPLQRRPLPGELESGRTATRRSTHPTLKLDPTPYLTAPPTGRPRGERLEGHGVHAGRRRSPGSASAGRSSRRRPAQAPVGTNTFPFNPIFGIGYIWHCHLLEHEDNEMMRPMTVIPIRQPGVAYPVGFRGSPGVNRGLVDFNGVDYEARVAHTSVAGQTPPHASRFVGTHQQPERRLGGSDHLRRG